MSEYEEYDGKEALPDEVSLPCVDWSFYFVLSKTVSKVIIRKTSVVYARIDTNLKDSAEEIPAQPGISPSSAIQMLYSQIVLKEGVDSINVGFVVFAILFLI